MTSLWVTLHSMVIIRWVTQGCGPYGQICSFPLMVANRLKTTIILRRNQFSQTPVSFACACAKSPQLCLTFQPYDCQSPLSMGFSRKENWSGFPLPSLENLPHPKIETAFLISPALTSGFSTTYTIHQYIPIRHKILGVHRDFYQDYRHQYLF